MYFGRANHAVLDHGIDLLAPTIHQQLYGAKPSASTGIFCVTKQTGGLLVGGAPSTGSVFRMVLAVAVPRGGSGYIVAKTDGAGSRFFGLYLQTKRRGIVFYYRTAESSEQQLSAIFPADVTGVDVSDGGVHELELWVSLAEVSLVIDGHSTTVALDGPVADCGAPDAASCVTYIGQRQGGYPLIGGCVSVASVQPLQAVRGIASTPAHSQMDGTIACATDSPASTRPGPAHTDEQLLQPAVHGQAAIPLDEEGAFCVAAESGGLLIANAPAVGSMFRLSLIATIPKGGYGYLVARTDAAGVRSFGLYVSDNHAGVTLYYQTAGSSKQQSITFPTAKVAVADGNAAEMNAAEMDVADGNVHSIELIVALKEVTLVLDGHPTTKPLRNGPVHDCGGPDPNACITYVGQRQGGYPLVGGCIAAAAFHPTATFDLLEAVAGGEHGGGAAQCKGVALDHFPVEKVGAAFSVELSVRLGTSSSGYLFSKGAGASGSRYYSLYLRRHDGALVLYYRSKWSTVQKKVVFDAGIEGNTFHTIVLSVDSSFPAQAMVLVDGSQRYVQPLDGAAVDDCGAPSPTCTLHLAQRDGGYELESGCILSAVLHPRVALSSAPAL